MYRYIVRPRPPYCCRNENEIIREGVPRLRSSGKNGESFFLFCPAAVMTKTKNLRLAAEFAASGSQLFAKSSSTIVKIRIYSYAELISGIFVIISKKNNKIK